MAHHKAKTVVYNLRDAGQYYDTETELNYNYFRDYDPQTGRYIESDPIGLIGGINTYRYVGDDPVEYGDPTGRCPWCIAAAIGAVTGGGFDLAVQLLENGGRLKCVDWGQVGVSAATGAALSALAPTGLLLGRGGARAAQYGYGQTPGLLNRWAIRFGWSGPSDGLDVLSLRVGRPHFDIPGIGVPSGANAVRDGVVSGAGGVAAAHGTSGSCDECSKH